MKRNIPSTVVAIVLVFVLAVVGWVYYRGLRTPPPQEQSPLGPGGPVGGVAAPEHGGSASGGAPGTGEKK
jgi:hypothetical protein